MHIFGELKIHIFFLKNFLVYIFQTGLQEVCNLLEYCLFEHCLLGVCSDTYARTLVIENCHFKSCEKAILTKNGGGYNFIIKNNIIEDTTDSIGELNDIIFLKFNSNYLTNNYGRISFKRTRSAKVDNNMFNNHRLTNFNHLLNIDGEIEYVHSFVICNNFFGDFIEGGSGIYSCINLNNEYTFRIKQYSNNNSNKR